MTFSRTLQRTLLVTGGALCLIYVGFLAYRAAGSRAAVQSLPVANEVPDTGTKQNRIAVGHALSVDQSLWSEKRTAAYLESLAMQFPPPIAVLRVPRINIEVAVFDGTSELVLNRGVGRIIGTATPGQPGNIGIAGHRDGFFRGLKDVVVGDSLTLTTADETAAYVIDRITIVSPDDVSVLAQTQTLSMTLVTCYPFYFIGHAPKRYIVRCSLKERTQNSTSVSGPLDESTESKSGG